MLASRTTAAASDSKTALCGRPPPVSMGQGGGSIPAVSIQKSPRMALAYPENLGSLWSGDLVFQNVVKHLESR